MKVYFFYICIPESVFSNSEDAIAMEKFEFVMSDILKYGRLDRATNSKIALYAITDDKYKAKEFEKFHDMSLFRKIVHKMSKQEYEDYKKSDLSKDYTHDRLELEYYPSGGYDNVSILLTSEEYNAIQDSVMSEIENMMYEYCNTNYHIFKDKYIEALDVLLYCTHHVSMYSVDEDEVSSVGEAFYGYGITVENAGGRQLTTDLNVIAAYADFFRLILRKEK